MNVHNAICLKTSKNNYVSDIHYAMMNEIEEIEIVLTLSNKLWNVTFIYETVKKFAIKLSDSCVFKITGHLLEILNKIDNNFIDIDRLYYDNQIHIPIKLAGKIKTHLIRYSSLKLYIECNDTDLDNSEILLTLKSLSNLSNNRLYTLPNELIELIFSFYPKKIEIDDVSLQIKYYNVLPAIVPNECFEYTENDFHIFYNIGFYNVTENISINLDGYGYRFLDRVFICVLNEWNSNDIEYVMLMYNNLECKTSIPVLIQYSGFSIKNVVYVLNVKDLMLSSSCEKEHLIKICFFNNKLINYNIVVYVDLCNKIAYGNGISALRYYYPEDA